MVFAYRLKDTNGDSRVIDGLVIRRTWQFSSDQNVTLLEKWNPVVLLKSDNIHKLKEQIDVYDKEARVESPSKADQDAPVSNSMNPFEKRLNDMSFTDLKQFAKDNGFDESEFSKFTRSKLVEYLLLEMSEKK